MSVSDNERKLEKLEKEKDEVQSEPHSGFKDATRFVQLDSEIEAIEDRITREKQYAERGEG